MEINEKHRIAQKADELTRKFHEMLLKQPSKILVRALLAAACSLLTAG
jgi:hypothetical protein